MEKFFKNSKKEISLQFLKRITYIQLLRLLSKYREQINILIKKIKTIWVMYHKWTQVHQVIMKEKRMQMKPKMNFTFLIRLNRTPPSIITNYIKTYLTVRRKRISRNFLNAWFFVIKLQEEKKSDRISKIFTRVFILKS